MNKRQNLFNLRYLLILVILFSLLITSASSAFSEKNEGKGVNVKKVEKRGVKIWTKRGCSSIYRLGELLKVRVKSQRSGYLTIFDLMSNGEVQILFPNNYKKDNYIKAGRIYDVPASTDPFKLKISPPKGRDQLLAVVTEEKKKLVREDFSYYARDFPKLKDSKGEVLKQVSKGVEVIPEDEWWAADSCSFSVGASSAKPADSQDESEISDGESQQGKINGRALIVGIAKYSEGTLEHLGREYRFSDLNYSIDDARDMKKVLKDDFEEVRLITGREATYEGIKGAINDWLAETGPDETVAFYFSGHGAFQTDMNGDEDDGFDEVLVPYDYAGAEKFIVDDELDDWLTGLPADKVVYVADSCHAGTSSKAVKTFTVSAGSKSGNSKVLEDSIGKDLGKKGSGAAKGSARKGIVTLEASKPSQDAIEDEELKHGVFTHYLIQGLAGAADENGDGRVSAEELFAFSQEEVLEYTDREQQPMCTGCDETKLYLSFLE